jgi:hyperosmotically inducible periplasmic protein
LAGKLAQAKLSGRERNLMEQPGKFIMKTKSLVLCAMVGFGAVSALPVIAADSDAGVYVSDSVITTKVKAKLAAKHMSTLTNIKVDTDKDGVVWLSGTAPTKDASDLAEMITKDTDGVRSVHNKIMVP